MKSWKNDEKNFHDSNHEKNRVLIQGSNSNSGRAQFWPYQSNSKKWPKGWKDQIAPDEIFSQKTTNKIFMYQLAPFILQNF